MKCPICEKDVELQKKQVGVDEEGTPIFHQYAVCRDCKKQWDLDKQRARKAVPVQKAGAASPAKTVPRQESPEKAVSVKTSQESKPANKPVSEKIVPGQASPEKKARQETASGKAVPVRKEGQKPLSAESSPERRAVRKPAAAGQPSEEKPVRKPVPGEAAPGGKTIRKAFEEKPVQKPVPEETSGEGKPVRKPTAAGQPFEEKTVQKPVSGDASAEGKPARNPASPGQPSEKKAGRKPVSGELAPEKKVRRRPGAENAQGKKTGAEKPTERGERPVSANKDAKAQPTDRPRKPAANKSSAAPGGQRYGNIPPDKIRAKKEHAVRKGYEDMLSTDPNYKPPKKKKSIPEGDIYSAKQGRHASVKQRPHTKAELEDDYEENEDVEYEGPKARFRIVRILFGILSIAAAGFFAYGGFFTGLEGIASGGTASAGTAFIVYGICMLVSGLILIIMQNRDSILAFILPMAAYFGGGIFTFLNRKDDSMLLYCAVAGAVLGIIFLILGIVSRNSGSDESDDYDDPFDDDYE